MTEIQELLFEYQDEKYAKFQAGLTPTVSIDHFIGVRVPVIRNMAKNLYKEGKHKEFLLDLPHYYYDENMLHGFFISLNKDYNECIQQLDAFLPYVDNWAVCDTVNPVTFKKHKEELLEKIQEWMASNHTYTCRFGMLMLMKHFLDKDFQIEYLDWVSKIRSEEYYVNMMIAWFFASALTKQWEDTIPYIENYKLDIWTHNKAIQKGVESLAVPKDRKEYLKSLKRKL